MKKTIHLIALLLCVLTVSLCACSSDNDDMYQFAGDDNLVTMAFSPEDIVRNAGFKPGTDGLQAPEGFDRLTGNNQAVKTLLSIKGIDTKTVLFTARTEKDHTSALLVARVTDKGGVAKFLEDQKIAKAASADGYDIYAIDNHALMLGDNIMVIMDRCPVDNAAASLKLITEAAAKNPLKDWQKEVLNGDDTFRMVANPSAGDLSDYDMGMTQLSTGMYRKLYGVEPSAMRAVITADLDGNKLEGESHVCDAEGKALKIKADCKKIDTSLLKYCHEGDQTIIMSSAFGLVDWKETLSDVLGSGAEAAIVANILADVDGTVMVSGAVTDISAMMSSANGFQLTVAAQFKDAKKYADQLETLFKGQITSYGDVRTVRIPGFPEFSYTVKGNTLIASVGAPITDEGSKVFKGTDFSGKLNVFAMNLPAGNANVTYTPLPFSPRLSFVSDTAECEFSLKLEGSDTPLLEQLIKFASQF